MRTNVKNSALRQATSITSDRVVIRRDRLGYLEDDALMGQVEQLLRRADLQAVRAESKPADPQRVCKGIRSGRIKRIEVGGRVIECAGRRATWNTGGVLLDGGMAATTKQLREATIR